MRQKKKYKVMKNVEQQRLRQRNFKNITKQKFDYKYENSIKRCKKASKVAIS